MPDVTLHNIPLRLVARVQQLAAARRCSLQAAWESVLDRGLAQSDADISLDADHARVLEEATIALRNLRNDPGFALIGRLPPSPSATGAPDSSASTERRAP